MAGAMVWDVSQVLKLEASLGKVAGGMVAPITGVVQTSGAALLAQWISGATASSGSWGKAYPGKIQGKLATSIGSIRYDAQPTVAWSFEYGSVNQPPHLDGLKAFTAISPSFTTAVAAAATKAVVL